MSESIASQERRTQAFVGDSDPIKPWSVEQDADALMDDLFSDFERLLEGEMSLPGETVRPEPAPMPALTIPSMTGSLSPPTEEAIATEAQTDALLSVTQPDAAPLAPQSPPSKTSPSKGQKSNLHWDKLLLAFAGTALLGVLAWLALQEKLKLQQWWEQLITQVRGQPVTLLEATSVSASDAQFMTYMSRSLDLIERKVANSPPQNPNSGQSALPPAPGTSSAAGTVPQVIYNIYQPAPGLANGLLPAPSPAAPRAESQPAPPKPPAPAPEPETRSSAPPAPAPSAPTRPQAAAPAPPPSKPNPRTLAPAPTAAPAPPPPSAPQVEASSPESETIPSLSNYSLYGLIVNSDGSSAALFKVNGTTQRIREGEAIGDSGWTLFSVSNQSAVVRRNGTVREIYAGQEF